MARRAQLTTRMFEYAIDRHHNGFYRGCREWSLIYAHHWIVPFIEAAYVELDRIEDTDWGDKEYFYRPTAEGVRWWVERRYNDAVMCSATHFDPKKPELYCCNPVSLRKLVQGTGVGGALSWCLWGHFPYEGAVFAALREGLLEYSWHRDYYAMPRATNEWIGVTLTAKGIAFYDSLPDLDLECVKAESAA